MLEQPSPIDTDDALGEIHALIRHLRMTSWVACGFVAVATLGTLGMMLYSRSQYMAIFADFNTDLPALTQFFIARSDEGIIGIALTFIAVLLFKEWRFRAVPGFTILLNSIGLIMVIVVFWTYREAMMLPLTGLMR